MKKSEMLRNAVLLSLLVGATTGFSMAAQAEEVADSMEFAMDEYVVTASRTQTAKVDTPANVTVIGAEKIESGRYQDVSEVLKDVPGATVVDASVGATEKRVILNGDDRVLVLVDGRRVNFSVGSSSGRSGFDMNMLPDPSLIERIEVVKGHGGSLYGSDAVGGVINIITKKADRTYGKVSAGFGSNQSRDMGAMYSIREDKTGVTVAASKIKQGYYKYKDKIADSTKRFPGETGYNNEKVSLKIEQELTDSTNLELGYDYSKMDGTSFYGFGGDPGWYSWTNLDKKTNRVYAKYDWLANGQDAGWVNVYYNKLDYEAKSYSLTTTDEKTYGFEAQQEITTSSTNKIVVGASYYNSDVEVVGDNNYDDSIHNLAVFANNQWEFAPTWSLNAGVRYDKHSEAGSKTTMSAGLNKKFNETSHAYVNWGQVFKAPTTDDMFWNDSNMRGNPELDPETGDNWTIGYGTKIADKTNVNISCFYSDLEDAISWQKNYDDGIYYARNIGKQKKRGMEISVDHELNDNWDITASYTYTKVRNDNGYGFTRDLNYAPNTYRLGVRYHDEKWNTDLTMRAASGASTATINSWGTDYGKFLDSNFITLDMAVSYKATADWTVYAKGYNLTNKAYTESAGTTNGYYDYPAQSRRFIVGAEYSF